MVNPNDPLPRSKTLLEIITAAWHATGERGQLTRTFIRQWRAANPEYGKWPLWVRFFSGSPLAVRGQTKLDRHPDMNFSGYDEYEDEFYPE